MRAACACLPQSGTVFWLDAHPDHDSPILEELGIIKAYGLRGSTILIDDARLMRGHWKSVRESQVIDKLRAVNKHYAIEHIDSPAAKGDIICARP